MSGILEEIRDNLEYIQDYQEVQKTKNHKVDSDESITDKVMQDIQDIMPPEEKPDYAKYIMIGGAVLIAILLLNSGAKK